MKNTEEIKFKKSGEEDHPETATPTLSEIEQLKAAWIQKRNELDKLEADNQSLKKLGKTVEADSYEQKIKHQDSVVESLKVELFHKVLQNKQAFQDWLIRPYGLIVSHFFTDHNEFMGLMDCSCQDLQFDRRYGRRKASEKLIVQTLLKQYPLDDNFRLNYLSLGCYGLLQDFIIIGKLIVSGYKKFNIELVDPYYEMIEDTITTRFDKFKQLLTLVKQTYNVDLKIAFHNEAFHEIKEDAILDKPFHFINAIDYDEFKNRSPLRSFVEAHQQLDDKGVCMLSVKNYDLLLGKTKCIQKIFHIYDGAEILLRGVVEEVTKFIGTSLIQLLSGKDSIQYSSMGGKFFYQFSEMIEILPLFVFEKAVALNLTLNNCLGYEAAPEDYAYFLQLFTATNTTLNLSLVESLESFLEDKSSVQQDLGTFIGVECQSLASSHALLTKCTTLATLKGGLQIFGLRLLENSQTDSTQAAFFLWSQRLWEKAALVIPESEEKIIKPAGDKPALGISPCILMPPNYKPDSDINSIKGDFLKKAVPNLAPLPLSPPPSCTCKCSIS